jgi:subtilisin family serine protease
MHARFSGWQSFALAVALLSSLIGGVVVAQADAEPERGEHVRAVPEVSGVSERASGRAVAGAEPAVDPVAPSGRTQPAGGEVAVAYTVEEDGRAQIRVTRVEDHSQADDLVDQLSTRPEIAAAEVDVIFAALADPDADAAEDAGETAAARRDGPERERQWGLDLLEAERVWESAHACGQTIAVIDSGVHGEHPDLIGTVRSGKDMVHRGYAIRDISGHGTEVAGVASAANGNGRGISGLAPGSRVLPIAIEDAAGQMHASDLARGIKYAIEQGADVINLSLGGPVQSPNVEYWLREANEAGIPVVASAGNAYANNNPAIWPAASRHTIAVGAIAPTAVWAPFSSTGKYVDLAAPGVAILTTAADGGYVAANGTSLSAPFVSATVALMRARDPQLTPEQVRNVLVDTARDLGPDGWDPQFGHGAVDPVAALDAVGGTPRKCFTDIGELTLADQVERLAFAGVTDGCAPGRFCPAQHVTRGQMATFLSRAVNQPPTDADFFADDDSNAHQQGINRLAQANIARGCTAESFCPNDPVTRGQMAAFITRALDLPAVGVDAFSDDRGDVHEAAINALAAAGITSGCDAGQPERFCPRDTVNRAQMAAFLMRMIDSR